MTNITTPPLAILAMLLMSACYRAAPAAIRDKPVIDTIHLETHVTVTPERPLDINVKHAPQPSKEVPPCR
jgi:hypothetical protein